MKTLSHDLHWIVHLIDLAIYHLSVDNLSDSTYFLSEAILTLHLTKDA